MKNIKIITVVGLVLAVSGMAGAFTIGGQNIPENQPLVMKLINYDVGTLYTVPNGTYNEAQLHALPTAGTNPPGFRTLATGAAPNEDAWGILRVENIQDITQTTTFYNRYTATQEITAIFYGEHDTFLNQTGSGVDLTQNIHGVGMNLAFFVDSQSFNVAQQIMLGNFNPALGPGARLTPNPVYPTVTDGTLLWTVKSVPGWDTTFPTDEFFTTFRPNAIPGSTSADGGFLAQKASLPFWGTGTANDVIGSNAIAPGVDMKIDFTGNPGSFGWLVNSNDPIQFALVSNVPEPVTMLSAMMGVAGLVGYIRRRRA